MSGKYWLLERYLTSLEDSVGPITMTVPELERILGFLLPPSAHRHAAWWSNTPSHPHAVTWMAAGYKVDGFELGAWVCFRKYAELRQATSPRQLETERYAVPASPPTQMVQSAIDMQTPTSYTHYGVVALISCTKSKISTESAARDLYTSSWFRKAKAYVERLGMTWYILSAEHHLVHPDAVLAPYERTLKEMSLDARRSWADQVTSQILSIRPAIRKCVVLAGQAYRECLLPRLQESGIMTEVPMKGLTQGRQLHWLDHH